MKSTYRQFSSICGFLYILVQTTTQVAAAGSQFSSHVSINTPARSFSHGVGDPIPSNGYSSRRSYHRQPQRSFFRSLLRKPSKQNQRSGGYPRVKPAIPFNVEDTFHDNSLSSMPWQQNNYNTFKEVSIPVLPPSPYKVDSPDPESLWPEGLFLPPYRPYRFGPTNTFDRRADADTGEVLSDPDPLDPYLLEGSEAIAAVMRSASHGHLYFHEIPHIQSLLANQEIRADNNLKPHRIASLRHTWPYNRP